MAAECLKWSVGKCSVVILFSSYLNTLNSRNLAANTTPFVLSLYLSIYLDFLLFHFRRCISSHFTFKTGIRRSNSAKCVLIPFHLYFGQIFRIVLFVHREDVTPHSD